MTLMSSQLEGAKPSGNIWRWVCFVSPTLNSSQDELNFAKVLRQQKVPVWWHSATRHFAQITSAGKRRPAPREKQLPSSAYVGGHPDLTHRVTSATIYPGVSKPTS
jgi:hypothetical protein